MEKEAFLQRSRCFRSVERGRKMQRFAKLKQQGFASTLRPPYAIERIVRPLTMKGCGFLAVNVLSTRPKATHRNSQCHSVRRLRESRRSRAIRDTAKRDLWRSRAFGLVGRMHSA